MATFFFLLVMLASGYYVYLEALDGGQYITVPAIEGMPITEANLLLVQQGLEMGRPTQVPHSSIPKYHVVTQRPTPGRVVRTGRTIYPTVSMGADFLTAPNLLDKSLELAQEEVDASRFRLGSIARIPDDAPRDTVLAQDPSPGRSIPNQGDINLLLSAGPSRNTSFMPDIRGMAVDEVLKLLAPKGVKVVPNKVDIPGARMDVVLNQDPQPGALIYDGQVVSYDVKPSGSVELVDTRHHVEVRHTMTYDWYDRDIKIFMVDHLGNRKSLYEKVPLYDTNSMKQFIAGSVIKLPLVYLDEVKVEVQIDGKLETVYELRGGNDPVRRDF